MLLGKEYTWIEYSIIRLITLIILITDIISSKIAKFVYVQELEQDL
jgi:hypothetical protein